MTVIDASADLLAFASVVGTIVVARARALSIRRLAFAYLGGVSGMIITMLVVGAPFMIVAHGSRPRASNVAALLLVGVVGTGIATGVVRADRKRSGHRGLSFWWVTVGSAVSVLVVTLSVTLRAGFSSPLSVASVLVLLLLLPVLGWTAAAQPETTLQR